MNRLDRVSLEKDLAREEARLAVKKVDPARGRCRAFAHQPALVKT